jgi:hypothetical protein
MHGAMSAPSSLIVYPLMMVLWYPFSLFYSKTINITSLFFNLLVVLSFTMVFLSLSLFIFHGPAFEFHSLFPFLFFFFYVENMMSMFLFLVIN